MTAFIYALGMVLFFLGVVASIALHEVGHMVPAKLFGVKVTQYFVGFGKTLWSTKKGDTEYGVKMFPLGGFIKMIGMLPPEKRHPDGRVKGFSGGTFGKLIADARAMEYEQVTAEDQGRLFYQKAWWKKVIVMAGGPMMNVFLAVGILSGVFMLIGVSKPTLTVSSVSYCVQPATTAPAHGCRPSDPASPARTAGFKPGDRVVSVNGVRMTSWDQFSHVIRRSENKKLAIVVDRGGKDVTLTADPTVNKLFSLNNGTQIVHAGFLGVSPGQTRQRQDFGYVVSTLGTYTVDTGKALVNLPSRLVNIAEAAVGGHRDQNSPMSVVGASRVAGQVASDSAISIVDRVATMLMLLGVINLFVALFNFIPLLPLDGGHIAGALYEALRRAVARLRRRPDPGYADVAQMLPIAYAAASVLVVMGALLVWTDIVNPIRLTG